MVIQKNRCRTTVLSRFGEMPVEPPFTGDQVVCLGHDQAAWTERSGRQRFDLAGDTTPFRFPAN